MAGFNAKWKLIHVDNLGAFHNATNTPDAQKNMLRALAEGLKTNPGAYVEELKVDKAAGKFQRIVYIMGEKKLDSGLIDLGKDNAQPADDGRPAKGKVTLEGDNKLVIHQKGADFDATYTFAVSGDELTATLVGGGVTAVSKYKKA